MRFYSHGFHVQSGYTRFSMLGKFETTEICNSEQNSELRAVVCQILERLCNVVVKTLKPDLIFVIQIYFSQI